MLEIADEAVAGVGDGRISVEDAQKYGEKHGIPFLSGDDILIASGLNRGG